MTKEQILEEISNEIRNLYKGIISDEQIEAAVSWWQKHTKRYARAFAEELIGEDLKEPHTHPTGEDCDICKSVFWVNEYKAEIRNKLKEYGMVSGI